MADEPLDLDALRNRGTHTWHHDGTHLGFVVVDGVVLSIAERDRLVAELVSEREKTEQLRAERDALRAEKAAVEYERARHDAYADPLNGGYDGYQAACWECDWRGLISDEKGEVQDAARVHADEMARAALEASTHE